MEVRATSRKVNFVLNWVPWLEEKEQTVELSLIRRLDFDVSNPTNVKFALEHAVKVQRGGRGIALHFL